MRTLKISMALLLVLSVFVGVSDALNMVDSAVNDTWDRTSQSFRISYVASEAGWDVSEETALTNTVHPLVTFTHTTSGTPANNIGLSLDWYQETAAANTELGARMAVIATDTTAASEDFQIDWMLMTAGATPATKLSLGSTGVMTLVGGTLLDNSTATTLTVTETNIGLTGDTTVTGAFVTTEGADPAEETSLTNTVNPILSMTHTTDGAPANGIGLGIDFTQETTAGNEMIMSIDAVVTDVTGASEDADFVLSLMDAGDAAAEVLRVTSDGVLNLVNAETIDNSVNGTITYTATTHAFTGNATVSGSVDITGAAGLILENDETITNAVDGTILLTAPVVDVSAALTLNFVTSDPCGTYPEGSIFYNDTANVPCFCNQAGDDLKIADGAACF